MTKNAALLYLQDQLKYEFKNTALLKKAVTHPSAHLSNRASAFERLEFLGDRVLGLIVADLLYDTFPNEKEGDLAKRLAALVNRESCTTVAQKFQLEALLNMAAEDVTPKTSVLADTIEAVIGAMYLDGGLEAARPMVQREWTPLLKQNKTPPKDAKTALQEWAQRRGHSIPSYEILQAEGPAHAPIFVVRAHVAGQSTQAQGHNKRQAEQQAAALLLERVAKNESK